MDRYLDVWSRPDRVQQILLIAIGIAALQLILTLVVAITEFTPAVVVPIAIVFGPAGLWGVAIGAVFAELALGGVGVAPVARFVDVTITGILGVALWRRLPRTLSRQRFWQVIAIIPVAVSASIIGGGVNGLVVGLIGGYGVAAILPALLVDRIWLAAVLSPLLVALLAQHTRPVIRPAGMSRWVALGVIVGVSVLAVAWILGTALFGLAHRDRLAFAYVGDALAAAIPAPVDAVALALTGAWAWTIYVLGAVLAGFLLMALLHLSHQQPAGQRPREWRD